MWDSSSGNLRQAIAWRWFVILLASVATWGCGAIGDTKLANISGLVTFEGKPVPCGTINVLSKGGATGTGAMSAQGRYTLSTVPGDYQVAVRATDGFATMDAAGKPVAAKSLVPEKYSDINTSGLTMTAQSGKNEINFDLQP